MYDPEMKPIDVPAAIDFIRNTRRSVFLTGRAGTGKTHYLRALRRETHKQHIVLAPTGIAAIQALGVTIHSFFQLPFIPIVPTHKPRHTHPAKQTCFEQHSLLARSGFGRDKIELIRSLELIIIDEIGMVRADVMDAMDYLLRHYRHEPNKPFGGIQVLLIGDLFQLPPVLKDQDWAVLSTHYDSPYFFSSRAFRELNAVYIELQKVYRQDDPVFIDILNQVRGSCISDAAMEKLMTRYKPLSIHEPIGGRVWLTTHNRKADQINQQQLQALPSEAKALTAIIRGEFPESSYPAEATLWLKPGAQVMFIRNDSDKSRRYFNGKTGILTDIEENTVTVSCKEENGEINLIKLRRETWKNIRYRYHPQTRQLEEEEIGSFAQFPLRLAWAITIHKSQGLSFDAIIMDAAEAFAAGQVYVGLSRCRSLAGITLISPIRPHALVCDERVTRFIKGQVKEDAQLIENYRLGIHEYQRHCLLSLFDYRRCAELFHEMEKSMLALCDADEATGEWLKTIAEELNGFQQHGLRFRKELQGYLSVDDLSPDDRELAQRIRKAAGWFLKSLQAQQRTLLACPVKTIDTELVIAAERLLADVYTETDRCCQMLETALEGFTLTGYHRRKKNLRPASFPLRLLAEAPVFEASIANPGLYQLLMLKRKRIALARKIPAHLVCSAQTLEQMAGILPTGPEMMKMVPGMSDAKIRQYGKAFLKIVKAYCAEHGLDYALELEKSKGKNDTKLSGTRAETLHLLQSGMSIDDVARARNLKRSTIVGHLVILAGERQIDPGPYIPGEYAEKFGKLMETIGPEAPMKLIREAMPELDYDSIRLLLITFERGIMEKQD